MIMNLEEDSFEITLSLIVDGKGDSVSLPQSPRMLAAGPPSSSGRTATPVSSASSLRDRALWTSADIPRGEGVDPIADIVREVA